MRSSTLPTSLMASAAVGSSMMTTLGVEGGGARDGDRLALAAGQLLDVLVDALDVDLEPVEMLRRHLARLCRWSTMVRPSELAAGLAAEIDVLEDRHVPGEREVLVDHLDADVAGVARAAEMDRPCRRRRARPRSAR